MCSTKRLLGKIIVGQLLDFTKKGDEYEKSVIRGGL
jgi:hypothetical protein